MALRRDVALVLSGGGMNGVLMELGFLKRLRESSFWPRVGWIFGTSAGALVGTLAAVDRLDDLERFLLALRPEETFRPHRLWQLPLVGLHDYALPKTIDERLGDRVELARDLAAAPIELVVVATDVTDDEDQEGTNARELVWSSRTTAPEEFADAALASAAISALVLPLRVRPPGGRADPGLPLPPALSPDRRRRPRRPAAPARARPAGRPGARPDRRAGARRGARRTRRAGAPRRHDREA